MQLCLSIVFDFLNCFVRQMASVSRNPAQQMGEQLIQGAIFQGMSSAMTCPGGMGGAAGSAMMLTAGTGAAVAAVDITQKIGYKSSSSLGCGLEGNGCKNDCRS
jgi:hypothetical protein